MDFKSDYEMLYGITPRPFCYEATMEVSFFDRELPTEGEGGCCFLTWSAFPEGGSGALMSFLPFLAFPIGPTPSLKFLLPVLRSALISGRDSLSEERDDSESDSLC